jgi:hypothetical protein
MREADRARFQTGSTFLAAALIPPGSDRDILSFSFDG